MVSFPHSSFPTKGHLLQEPENSSVESYLGPQTLTQKKQANWPGNGLNGVHQPEV